MATWQLNTNFLRSSENIISLRYPSTLHQAFTELNLHPQNCVHALIIHLSYATEAIRMPDILLKGKLRRQTPGLIHPCVSTSNECIAKYYINNP